MVYFCTERGLCMDNTCFKYKSLQKYTRVAKGQDGVEIKNMRDLLLLKKHMLQDVRLVRGMGQGLSDQHVVLCKIKMARIWIKRREIADGARRIRSEKMREYQYGEGYVRCVESKSRME